MGLILHLRLHFGGGYRYFAGDDLFAHFFRGGLFSIRFGFGSFALDGIALGIQFDEFVVHINMWRRGTAFENGFGRQLCVQPDGADGIVVAWNDVIDIFRRTVGVHDGNYRNAQLAGLFYRDIFMADINDEQCVGQSLHVLDAAQAALQFDALTGQLQHFLLNQVIDAAVLTHSLKLFESLDGRADGAVVGQHAAQPAVRDKWHAAPPCFFFHGCARGPLRAYEHDGTTLGRQFADETHRVVQHRQRFFQVDDVDLATGPKNIGGHFGVPITGLVTEMYACFEHLAHGYVSHVVCPLNTGIPAVHTDCGIPGLVLHAPVAETLLVVSGHPSEPLWCMCVFGA